MTATIVAMALALNSGASAQTRDSRSGDTVKITGCLGNQRSGVSKDYVLTNVKMVAATRDITDVKIPQKFKVNDNARSELKAHVGHQVEVVGLLSNATARDIFHPQGVTGPTFGATGSSTTKDSGGSTTGGVTTSSPVSSGSKAVRGGSSDTHVSANTDLPQITATSVRMVAATCTAQ